jgi:hypothetical protein
MKMQPQGKMFVLKIYLQEHARRVESGWEGATPDPKKEGDGVR